MTSDVLPLRRIDSILAFLGFAALVALVGYIGNAATMPMLDWYHHLRKPALNPPDWIFGPVWGALYIMIAIAGWLVWPLSKGYRRGTYLPYGIQLVANSMWSVFFFGMQRPDVALADLVLLWITVVWTMISFRDYSKPAAILLMPYLAWITFAGYLNYGIWALNR